MLVHTHWPTLNLYIKVDYNLTLKFIKKITLRFISAKNINLYKSIVIYYFSGVFSRNNLHERHERGISFLAVIVVF